MALLAACFVCLLPERWRGDASEGTLPLGLATRLTAGAEIFGALFLFGASLWRHFHYPGPSGGTIGFGAYWFIVFWLTPLGLLTAYILVEGVIRFLHSFHDEPCAILPLALAELAVRAIRKSQPPPAPRADRVTLDGDLLMIAAAREYDWDRVVTIRYDGRLWRVRETRWDGGVWPHVYVLEPAPDDHLLRRVVDYVNR